MYVIGLENIGSVLSPLFQTTNMIATNHRTLNHDNTTKKQ
jgi:hypothetical protein